MIITTTAETFHNISRSNQESNIQKTIKNLFCIWTLFSEQTITIYCWKYIFILNISAKKKHLHFEIMHKKVTIPEINDLNKVLCIILWIIYWLQVKIKLAKHYTWKSEKRHSNNYKELIKAIPWSRSTSKSIPCLNILIQGHLLLIISNYK